MCQCVTYLVEDSECRLLPPASSIMAVNYFLDSSRSVIAQLNLGHIVVGGRARGRGASDFTTHWLDDVRIESLLDASCVVSVMEHYTKGVLGTSTTKRDGVVSAIDGLCRGSWMTNVDQHTTTMHGGLLVHEVDHWLSKVAAASGIGGQLVVQFLEPGLDGVVLHGC